MAIFKKNKQKDASDSLSRAVHVKSKTLGSSNEISMSVLDAAKENTIPEPSLTPVTESSFSQNLSESFASEVAKKKAKRRKNKIIFSSVAGLVLLLIILFIGFSVYAYVSRVNDFSASFNEVVECLAKSDEAISKTNDILEKPTSTESRRTIGEVPRDIESAQASLKDCTELVDKIKEKAVLPSEKEKAYQLQNSLEARIELLGKGEQILEHLKGAIEAIDSLEASKAKADEIATQEQRTATLVSNPTTENLNSAKTSIDSATVCVNATINSLEEAKKKCTEADLSNYSQYLTNKKEALSCQAQAIQAILDEDTTKAREYQTKYETADIQAKKYAETISYIGDPVLSVYKDKVKELSQEYENARTQVAAADEYLRKNM